MSAARGARSFQAAIALQILNIVLVAAIGGFAAAALVRFSPGFDVDENSWNPRISATRLEELHAAKVRQSRLPRFYIRYLWGALHGDFGQSDSFRTPVAALLRERAPASARLIFFGSAAGLLLGACFAWLAVWPRSRGAEAFSASISGFLLAIPPAVLALFFFLEQAPLWLALAIAVFPRVFGTIRAILAGVFASPALLAARARGVRPLTLAVRHVVGPALSQWIALAGVTLVLAFGLIVPIEALCDVPGLGQLAWKAALSRDLPLLCGLALLITLIAAVAQSIGELAAWRRRI